MKHAFVLAASLAITATSVAAQTTGPITEGASVGASGVAGYPVQVIGANGITYDCRPAVVNAAGVAQFVCRDPSLSAANSVATNGLTGALGAVGVNAAIAGLLVLTAVTAASGSN